MITQSDWSNLGDRDDPDDVMETSLTIDYDTQWLNCVYMHVPDISHNMNGGGGARAIRAWKVTITTPPAHHPFPHPQK